MKKALLKSIRVLLVAAGLCVGANAWGNVTPVSQDYSDSEVALDWTSGNTGRYTVSHRPNHQQLFAQALHALDHGEPTWFDDVQTRQIIDYNRRFQQRTPAEQFFGDCFRPAVGTDEPGAQWMSASALFQAVRAKVGGSLQVSSLLKFGRALANMPGLQRRVTNQNTQYLVVKL